MNKTRLIFFLKNIFPIIRIVFYLSLFIYFSIVSFEKISSSSLCLMYEKTGIICSTCGVTRAFTLIMHGNFIDAFKYNQVFVLAIFPIFSFLFIEDTYTYIKRLIIKKYKPSLLEYIFVGVILWKYFL